MSLSILLFAGLQLFSLRGEPLPQDIRLDSPLLNTFQEFITSSFVMALSVLTLILDSIDVTECQRLPDRVGAYNYLYCAYNYVYTASVERSMPWLTFVYCARSSLTINCFVMSHILEGLTFQGKAKS